MSSEQFGAEFKMSPFNAFGDVLRGLHGMNSDQQQGSSTRRASTISATSRRSPASRAIPGTSPSCSAPRRTRRQPERAASVADTKFASTASPAADHRERSDRGLDCPRRQGRARDARRGAVRDQHGDAYRVEHGPFQHHARAHGHDPARPGRDQRLQRNRRARAARVVCSKAGGGAAGAVGGAAAARRPASAARSAAGSARSSPARSARDSSPTRSPTWRRLQGAPDVVSEALRNFGPPGAAAGAQGIKQIIVDVGGIQTGGLSWDDVKAGLEAAWNRAVAAEPVTRQLGGAYTP
jgi:hypothetical protein